MLKMPFLFCLLITVVSASAQEWRTVERSPTERAILWRVSFANAREGWAVLHDGTLLRTTNGGKNWTRTKISPRVNNTKIPFFLNASIGVFFTNRQTGYVVANGEDNRPIILKTKDGGLSWKESFRGTEKSYLHNVWFADENHGWAVGGFTDQNQSGGIIYHTNDGGKSWKLQYRSETEEDFGFPEIKFVDLLNGWVVSNDTVLRTDDGGLNWTRVNLPANGSFFGADVLSAKDVWIVGGGGVILHTTDGGAVWTTRRLPEGFANHWLNSVEFIDTERGWVAGNDGVIFFTDDGGRTWKLEDQGKSNYIRGLTIAGEYIYAYGNGGIILRRSL